MFLHIKTTTQLQEVRVAQLQFQALLSVLISQVVISISMAHMEQYQDHGKGGLSLKGVAVMTETAMTAETAKTVKSTTVASLCCIL